MPELSKDTTPEEVYELLKTLKSDGLFTYILPTDPLGEEWVCGTEDFQLLKMNHEQVISFLIGNQMTLQWLMARMRDHGVEATLRPQCKDDHLLALWFTPDAIRDHFEGDDGYDHVATMTDEELKEIGQAAVSDDRIYQAFHRALEDGVNG